MNAHPTEETIRGKVKRGGALFATDEVRLLLGEIEHLRLGDSKMTAVPGSLSSPTTGDTEK